MREVCANTNQSTNQRQKLSTNPTEKLNYFYSNPKLLGTLEIHVNDFPKSPPNVLREKLPTVHVSQTNLLYVKPLFFIRTSQTKIVSRFNY